MTINSSYSRAGDENSTRIASVDEVARRRFEAAWHRGQPESIEAVLPAEDKTHYLATLEELVHIDLEFAWKARSGGDTQVNAATPLFVEDYVRRFARLNEPSVLQRLLQQEYRVRQRYGDRPSPDDFHRRFPGIFTEPSQVETGPPAAPAPERGLPNLPGYEVLTELGHGGMGVVYKARHVALNRVVAVKMLRDSVGNQPEIAARFRAEAEAVARLRHANIVQVYEVGTHDGRPYFTLEFVAGGSLDRLLAGAPQPPQPVAQLVAQLARAIHYAHAAAVIHRDLKPANVLLERTEDKGQRTEDRQTKTDGAGATLSSVLCPLSSTSPKVTDFGLAKLLETPSQTKTGELLGTPCYMAPEQARGDQVLVGPATDVYALGAILYECLTGRPPFRGVNSWDTIQQVNTQEPVPPRRLQPAVPADLETVCLKCLAKEPKRRYESAAALADDLERFLRDEPIRARPAGRSERLLRWCRRNPVVASLSGAFALVVIGSLIGLTALWLKAETNAENESRARNRADANFQKARAAVDQMLARVGFNRLYGVPQMDQVRRDLLEEAVRYYQDFLAEQRDDPALRLDTGRVYRQVGAMYYNLGQLGEAEKRLRDGIALLEPLVRESPDDLAARLELMYCHSVLGMLLRMVGRLPEAEQTFRQQLRLHRKSGPEAVVAANAANYASGLMNLGYTLQESGRADAAVEALQESVDVLAGPGAPADAHGHDLGIAKRSLGDLLGELGETEEAERLIRASLDLHGKIAARTSAGPLNLEGLGYDFNRLGRLLRGTGRYTEAEEAYRQALKWHAKLVADYPGVLGYRENLADTQIGLCDVLMKSGQPLGPELVQAHRDAAALYQKLADDYPAISRYRSHLADAKQSLGWLVGNLGRPAESERLLRESLGHYERLAADFPAAPQYRHEAAETLDRLGMLLRQTERSAAAEDLLRKAVTIQEQLVADFPQYLGYRRALIGRQANLRLALTDNGRPVTPAMVQAHRDAVTFFKQLADKHPEYPSYREREGASHVNLANVLQTTGETREGEAEFRRAVAIYETLVDGKPADARYRLALAISLSGLSELLWHTNRIDAAAEPQRRATTLFEQLAAEHPAVPDYRHRLAGAYYTLALYERNRGRPVEAEALHGKALAVRQKLVADFPDMPAYRLGLAKSHISRGIALVGLNRHAEAEEGYRWAIELLEKLLADTPDVPDYCNLLAGTLDNYAESLLSRNEPSEAKKYVERAIVHEQVALRAGPRNPQYVSFMGSHYSVLAEADVRVGDHAGAVRAALDLTRLYPNSGPKHREAAGFVARCIPLAGKDDRLSETERLATAQSYTGQALQLLRDAVQKGYKDAAGLRNDPHLAPLRSNDEFQRLLTDMEKRVPS
jgi:serine/threonine-protein kinase